MRSKSAIFGGMHWQVSMVESMEPTIDVSAAHSQGAAPLDDRGQFPFDIPSVSQPARARCLHTRTELPSTTPPIGDPFERSPFPPCQHRGRIYGLRPLRRQISGADRWVSSAGDAFAAATLRCAPRQPARFACGQALPSFNGVAASGARQSSPGSAREIQSSLIALRQNR